MSKIVNTPNLTRVSQFRFILLVKDLAPQRSFYEEIFAWPIVEEWNGGVMYDTGSSIFEMIQDNETDKPNASSRIAISVPDVWTLFEELKDKVKIEFPIRDNTWGDTSFRIIDPIGLKITFFTPSTL